MTIGKSIYHLRTESNLSQGQFATLFGVSQQSVQKWENGDSVPELSKIVKISKYFGVSLDAFILGNDNRIVEEMQGTAKIKPQYESITKWESYSANLLTEYQQCIDEGLDVENYKDVFTSVSKLPNNEMKVKMGDVLFDMVCNAKRMEEYPYVEPSDLESIKKLRKPYTYEKKTSKSLKNQISGAWIGRICGCMLGKPIEGIRTNEFIPFLKQTGNYPMTRYILRKDLEKIDLNDYKFGFVSRIYADEIDGMPVDDDTNYMVLYQEIVEKYGRDFTPFDVSRAWMDMQPKNAYCTAERIAFCNFVQGYAPPESAVYKNPYREWIGAQIRGDYFGYINPGNPELAAEMAWRDASISHTKNGIYGEMFAAAMIAVAAETNCVEDIILGGLAEIPHTSRLYAEIMTVVEEFKGGVSQKDCFLHIHEKYNEYTDHGWCHTIPNAMIVAAALLYGGGDYSRSICMAVEAAFDTDCNGATVGSVLGMANGVESIPEYWVKPINDTLHTSVFGVGTVKISDRIQKTMAHIAVNK